MRVPFLGLFEDYHDIEDFRDSLVRSRLFTSLKCVEIPYLGYDLNKETMGPYYVGLFYTGRKPGKVMIDKLAVKQSLRLYPN